MKKRLLKLALMASAVFALTACSKESEDYEMIEDGAEVPPAGFITGHNVEGDIEMWTIESWGRKFLVVQDTSSDSGIAIQQIDMGY